MKKKILSILLVLALSLGILAACAGGGDSPDSATPATDAPTTADTSDDDTVDTPASADEEMYTITMAYLGFPQPNEDAVFQAINELMQKEINMNFDPVVLGFGEYQDRLTLMLASSDKLDVLPINYTQASAYLNAGQIVNLGDYIFDYGQGIIDFMGERVALGGAVGDFIYGIPANKESASLAGIVMRQDIVDELSIDVSAISTYDDLTPIFAMVKEAYPAMDGITGTNLVSQIQCWDPLIDDFGVLMNDGQDTTVVNLFETEEYNTRIQRIHDWYRSGYIKLDAATTTETDTDLVGAGSLFSYFSPIKPGFLIQANAQTGMEMAIAYIGKDDGRVSNMISSMNVNFFNWGIAHQSEDKIKAMQFLNFAYTSPEFNNLINFGIEGQDYVRVDGSEALVDYPPGVDPSATYHLNMGWQLPNQFIGHEWVGQPENVWQQYQEFNDSAIWSIAFGFFYNPADVANELTALSSVASEFRSALETGSVTDPIDSLQTFNERLYAAGLQSVMDEKQTQLDAWLATR